MAKQLILGNWKMNKSLSDITSFCGSFKSVLKDKKNDAIINKVIVGIAPTFTGLTHFKNHIDHRIHLIAQNVSDQISGARTGQISVDMLNDLRVDYCLIGHSEVRQYLHETNHDINKKNNLLLSKNIIPVLCIGETLDEFEQHKTQAVLQKQLNECLADVDFSKIDKVVIAYEPIWAIGTGKTATNEIIKDCMKSIKQYLSHLFASKSSHIKLLYGGSVNEINAKDILAIEGVDGVLVGGASLDPQKFWTIIQSAK